MTKPIRVRTSYEGCAYITANRVYELRGSCVDSAGVIGGWIRLDDDVDHFVCVTRSKFLDGHDWEVLPNLEDLLPHADDLEVRNFPAVAAELVEALKAVRRGGASGCWCEMAIGNPMCSSHTYACNLAQRVIAEYTSLAGGGM